MALIGKIRKNFWFVLILLAMALASFIIMDVMGSGNNGGMFNSTTVGEVAGQKFDYRDFQRIENSLYGGMSDVYGRRNMLWNYLQEKAVVDKTNESLGLNVSQEELMELQFGNNLSPIVQNNFRTPQGGVDRQQLLQFKQAMETGQELNPTFASFWKEQEDQIIKQSIQDKIGNLVSKAMIIPKWQLEIMNNINNDNVTFEFVQVGFDKVQDSEIKITDEDYVNFMKKNPLKYTNKEETRTLSYVNFPVNPSKEDSMKIIANLSQLKPEFRASTNDSLFTATNSGSIAAAYVKLVDASPSIKDSLASMSVGSVVGPYFENGAYVISKLVDKRVLPDSVKARHILRRADASNAVALAAARKSIDSLKTLITSGKAKFDSLAIRNSEDTGSGAKGGDLGTFAQGTMVKPFNDACFKGSKGGLYTVETQFGVHLIEVQDQKFLDKSPKYLLATIPALVIPSEDTQNKIYDKVSAILSKTKTIEDLEAALKGQSEVTLQNSRSVKANDYNFESFNGETARQIIRWAFDADVKKVSPSVFSIQDNVNFYTKNYLIAGLKAINKPGLYSVEEAKAILEMQVKNEKKAEILKSKITGSDINAIAAQFGTTIDTAVQVNFASPGIPAVRASEPLVVAKAFKMKPGEVSKPIKGNAGVYVIKLTDKVAAVPQNTNFDMIKSQLLSSARQNAGYRIWDALKKKYAPKDNRSKFY
jgi:peptidyl-prolyl cis-trans isomerase D